MRLLRVATFLLPLTLVPALATAGSKPAGTRIEFSAQAQRMAPNDLERATAFVEIAGTAHVVRAVGAAQNVDVGHAGSVR